MTRRIVVAAVLATLVAVAPAFAHPGHDQKLLGTLLEVSTRSIVVKATKDGTRTTIALTPATKIVRGKAKLAPGDLKVGDRVVVNIGPGKPPLAAVSIQVGVTPATR